MEDSINLELERLREDVKTVRWRSRLTIKDVAERSGVSPSTISQFETGIKNTTVQSLVAMLKVQGYKLEIVKDDK